MVHLKMAPTGMGEFLLETIILGSMLSLAQNMMTQIPKGRLVKGPKINQYVGTVCHLLFNHGKLGECIFNHEVAGRTSAELHEHRGKRQAQGSLKTKSIPERYKMGSLAVVKRGYNNLTFWGVITPCITAAHFVEVFYIEVLVHASS